MQTLSFIRRSVAIAVFASLPMRVVAQIGSDDVAAKAEALARAGQTVEAQQVVTEYLQQHPRSVPVNVVAGELEQFRHNWTRAMEYFETALETDPTDQPARSGEREAATALALHQRATQDAEGALATLRRAHAVLPRDTTILTDLALQAQSMHRLTTAHDAIVEALALEPSNGRALYAAAGIQYDRGHSVDAVREYRAFLAQHPDDATAHFGLGRALRAQQKPEEAKEELQRSVQLQPLQTEAYFQLGEIARESGQADEARSNYQRVLSRMPAHGGALTGTGILDYREHQYQDALTTLEQAVRAAPDYEPAHHYLGLTLMRLGGKERGERELERAVALNQAQQGKANPVAPE